MNLELINRVKREATLVAIDDLTIREVAKEEGISKSTVHKDLRIRLPRIDAALYTSVADIFQEHIATRHLHGGESTRRKYKMLTKQRIK